MVFRSASSIVAPECRPQRLASGTAVARLCATLARDAGATATVPEGFGNVEISAFFWVKINEEDTPDYTRVPFLSPFFMIFQLGNAVFTVYINVYHLSAFMI